MYTFTKYDDDGDVSLSVSNEHADIHEILERFQAFLYASGFTWIEEGSIVYEEPTIDTDTLDDYSYKQGLTEYTFSSEPFQTEFKF
tara:strand:- start:255 stop:512 length:258 start_codon:yes stop_codon:yes gene_type:complete